MDVDEITLALTEETERVEWKQSLRDRDDALRAVCALANDLGDSRRPGFFVVGVDDKGAPVGGYSTPAERDSAQQKLASWLGSVKLLPTPSFSIEAVAHRGDTVLIVRIEPMPVPPLVKVDGVAYVRRGTTTSHARDADILRLMERRADRQMPFDARPVAGATLDDLDVSDLREEHATARDSDGDAETFPPLPQWLYQQELGRPTGSAFVPNAAAILLHGKSPQTFFPGARVELVRYGGEDPDAPVSFRQSLTGTVGAQIDGAWRLIQTQVVHVPVHGEGARSPFAPEYPVEALKELVRNLVQHRLYEGTNSPGRIEWYDDRIELSNPGGPFGQASEGELGDHSDYRNPLLTQGLVKMGYVEQLGRGIRRVRKLLATNGNPPLQVETDGFTRVVVRRRA